MIFLNAFFYYLCRGERNPHSLHESTTTKRRHLYERGVVTDSTPPPYTVTRMLSSELQTRDSSFSRARHKSVRISRHRIGESSKSGNLPFTRVIVAHSCGSNWQLKLVVHFRKFYRCPWDFNVGYPHFY